MDRLRLSISEMMIGTAIAAGGLGLIQLTRANGDSYRLWHEFVIGVVPLACLLIFGMVVSLIQLIRRGDCPAFILGFEAAGWSSLFLYASFLAVNYDFNYRTLSYIRPITNYVFPNGCMYADIPAMSLHMTILFLPPFFLSVIAGLIAARLGISIVRRSSPKASVPDAAGIHDGNQDEQK